MADRNTLQGVFWVSLEPGNKKQKWIILPA
jgi:hypothetical protein